MDVSRVEFSRLFEEGQPRMGVDHVLDQRHEILRHQIEATGTGRAVVHRPVEIVVRSAAVAHIGVDHGQELNESRGFVMIVVDYPTPQTKRSIRMSCKPSLRKVPLLSPKVGEGFQRNVSELFATAGDEQDGFPIVRTAASLKNNMNQHQNVIRNGDATVEKLKERRRNKT